MISHFTGEPKFCKPFKYADMVKDLETIIIRESSMRDIQLQHGW